MASGEMNLVSWMREEALPFWASNGIDIKNGGFVEQLNQDGSPSPVPYKRVRVQGRQLFSFSTAALLGWHKNAASIAEHGYAFLKKKCRDEKGRWVRRLARDGAIIDAQMDLYDTAFVVLGLATYYQLTQKNEALDLIKDTLNWVATRKRATDNPPMTPKCCARIPICTGLKPCCFAIKPQRKPDFLTRRG
jgi:mannose/cellobiose epimerase-like protein (N-acyl-D-glucosamine 2-epimerase family)